MMLRAFSFVLIDLLVISCLASRYLKQFDNQITEDPENPQTKIITPDPDPTLRIDYTESYETQPRMKRAVTSEVTLSINEIIMKNKDEVIADLDKLINAKRINSDGSKISNLICTAKQIEYASAFKKSLKNWMTSIIIGRKDVLSSIQFNEFPSMNKTFSDKTSISDLKLTDIVIKGMENLRLLKHNKDLCEMSTEIEFKIPNIQIMSLYTIKGIIDDDLINGNGNLRVDIDGLYFYRRSMVTCNENDSLCKSRNKNITSKANAESVKVNITGIKYNDFDEQKFNYEINKYINKNRMETAISLRIMNNIMDKLIQDGPLIDLPLLESLKNKIIKFSTNRSMRCLFHSRPHEFRNTIPNFYAWD